MQGCMQRVVSRIRSEERGQTLVMFVVFIAVIAMSAAVVIDGGQLFTERRDMQGVADAAAMAGARAIPSGSSEAESVANSYITAKNSSDGASAATVTANNDTLDVTVEIDVDGSFLGMFTSSDTNTVTASAQSKAFSAVGVGKALPMALMRDTFSYDSVTEIKTMNASGPGNHGAVRLEEEPPCGLTSGANDFRNLIKTSANGGADSCPTPAGGTISTETGNMSGPTRQGLDDRVGSNSDSFSDVFEWDDDAQSYKVLKPNSPRIGVVPLVENTDGSSDWPNGQDDLVIVGYTMVYIGKTDAPGYPPYTNNGRSVWVTPVQGILPRDFTSVLGDYDSSADTPVVFRLTE